MARILQVCNTDFYLNGFLAPLVLALAERGHQVEVACDGDRVSAALGAAGIKVHRLAFPQAASPFQFARAIAGMRRLIRAGRFDCVNSHNRNASIVARVAAWFERVPAKIYTAHGFYFHDDQPALTRWLTVQLERVLAHLTDYTLSQSQEDIDLVVAKGVVAAGRIRYIGNGIDLSRFTPATAPQPLASRFRVVTIGRLVEGKGFGDLLEAFAMAVPSIPEAELVFIGGNIERDIHPIEQRLRERIAQLGLGDRVTITGLVPNVEDHLVDAQVFVLPSYREGMPRSLLEAMAAGVPACATDIRGCREIIEHGQTGWLFAPGDVAALAERLRWLSRNPDERDRVGRRGCQSVRQEFGENAYVARQVAAIEQQVNHNA